MVQDKTSADRPRVRALEGREVGSCWDHFVSRIHRFIYAVCDKERSQGCKSRFLAGAIYLFFIFST